MSFYRGQRVRLGEIAYRDPIIGRYGRARKGLGANTTALIGSGAATGAAVGSVVPVLGTAVGTVVGSLVGAISGLFGGGVDKTGLPKVPSSNADFNQALATKWYTLYLGGDITQDPAAKQGLAQAIGYWATQIAQDGPQRAWVNWSGSPRNTGNIMAAVTAYTPQYGNQYVLAPTTAQPVGGFVPVAAPANVPYTGAVPYTNVNATPGQVAAAPVVSSTVAQAGLLGGVSGSTLLLLGGGLLVGLLLMKRGSSSSPEVS